MSRSELADFLRSRRGRVCPDDAGPRRVAGLRRDEVAQRAHMSVDYYTRLEQGRGARPSPRILDALSTALELDIADRGRLYSVADTLRAAPVSVPRAARPDVRALLDRLPTTAALVTAANYDVIASSQLAAKLFGLGAHGANLARRRFLDGVLTSSAGDEFAEVAVARLRAATTRYPDDVELQALVRDLQANSELFRDVWQLDPTCTPGHRTKTVTHPVVGELRLNCDVLLIPEDDQQIVFVTADAGSASERALEFLAAS